MLGKENPTILIEHQLFKYSLLNNTQPKLRRGRSFSEGVPERSTKAPPLSSWKPLEAF